MDSTESSWDKCRPVRKDILGPMACKTLQASTASMKDRIVRPVKTSASNKFGVIIVARGKSLRNEVGAMQFMSTM